MDNYVITIGRELGSGGSMLGKALADFFGFNYIDKEILIKAADRMDFSADSLKNLDERSLSIWNVLSQTVAYEVPYISDEWYVPTNNQLFKTQTQIMKESVEQGPCVIVGRCSSYLFREYSKHRSIFLHSEEDARIARLERTIGERMSRQEMIKLMKKEDKERAKYYNFYTGHKWLDLREYDLVLDTTLLSDEETKDIVIDYLVRVFPELKK